jgi:hypothetical protein
MSARQLQTDMREHPDFTASNKARQPMRLQIGWNGLRIGTWMKRPFNSKAGDPSSEPLATNKQISRKHTTSPGPCGYATRQHNDEMKQHHLSRSLSTDEIRRSFVLLET